MGAACPAGVRERRFQRRACAAVAGGRIAGVTGAEDIHPSRTGLAVFFIDEALKETKEVMK
jgi:hypothetical protein